MVDDKRIKNNPFHFAVICPSCQSIIMSLATHSLVVCNCAKTSVDGGRDYFKVSAEEPTRVKSIKIRIE